MFSVRNGARHKSESGDGWGVIGLERGGQILLTNKTENGLLGGEFWIIVLVYSIIYSSELWELDFLPTWGL